MLLLLLACRSDTALEGKDADPGFDTGTPVEVPAEEECNGLDDDGDGEVDEDFADANGNGRVDCLDATCPPLDLTTADAVGLSDACPSSYTPPDDPFDIVVESMTLLMPQGTGSFPAVGHLDDDNGDGRLGDGDVPEVVVANMEARELVALHGDGSGTMWTWPGAYDYQNAAIADVDGDGKPNVVAVSSGREVVALDADGRELWRSAAFTTEIVYYMQVAAADLDGDGDVEVVVDGVMLDGATGALLRVLTYRDAYRTPAFADLDGDGRLEIVLGTEVFDADGNLLWEGDPPYGMVFGAIFDADADGDPEVLITNDDLVSLYEADGTLIRALPQWTNRMGPPCVADFDGDGAPEIGLANGGRVSVIEVDGAQLWSATSDDLSGYAGCSGYDFDQDGAYELLFGGEVKFAIYDGKTGVTRYEDTSHTSRTLWEYPVIADMDADGAAEILVIASAGGSQGVNVYGHRDGAWPSPGSTWCVHDYSDTNSPEDCSPLGPRAPGWENGNRFRARGLPPPPDGAPELLVSVTDACVADCTYGPVELAVAVENQGGTDVDREVLVEVLALEPEGERVVATLWSPPIPAGRRLDSLSVSLRPEDVGSLGMAVRVDGDEAVAECDEGNNREERGDLACP